VNFILFFFLNLPSFKDETYEDGCGYPVLPHPSAFQSTLRKPRHYGMRSGIRTGVRTRRL